METRRVPLSAPSDNHNRFRLDGKSAVVTGGGSGIGRSIGLAFARGGTQVHILELNRQAAEATAQEIRALGGCAEVHKCNVANGSQTQSVLQGIQAKSGVDILVNNAGVSHIGNLEATSEEEFDYLFSINVKGAYHCMRACIGHMKERGRGVIVNMTSIASSAGIADRFAYSMSKGAVLAMTMSVARDYVRHNIRCNCISPARVHTPFVDAYLHQHYPGREQEMFDKLAHTQPMGRMGQPDEVASLALFLCSDEAAFITGANYLIDGGFVNLRG